MKIIIGEAVIREELERDPTQYVRRVKGNKRVRGVFTVEELRTLFPDTGNGPWKDIKDDTCFYLAAVTGARRGELLVLRWRHVDFKRKCLNITEAWKDHSQPGK